MKMKEEGYKEATRKNFMEEFKNFFKTCTCFTRTMFKDLCPPYNDEDAATLLLSHFFTKYCSKNKDYASFLHTDKTSLDTEMNRGIRKSHLLLILDPLFNKLHTKDLSRKLRKYISP